MREHITGTEFSLELSASVVHGGVELCAPTSSPRTRDERRRLRQTAVVLTVVIYDFWAQTFYSCSEIPERTELLYSTFVITSACTSVNKAKDAHCKFDGAQQNTLWRLQWREHSWWHLRQYRPPGLELFVPVAQMCHQHEQDRWGSDADVERMRLMWLLSAVCVGSLCPC